MAELRQLQAEYETWRDGLPESLAESRTAQLLEGVCELDIEPSRLVSAAAGPRRPHPRGVQVAAEPLRESMSCWRN